jgi:ATP-dependent exoDNAse (exonuclease V) beta subunit
MANRSTYHDGRQWVMDFTPQAAEDKTLKVQRRLARLAEDLRLVYVALTRAVHRCHVVAGCFVLGQDRHRRPEPPQRAELDRGRRGTRSALLVRRQAG